jgi:hypothetical protein
MTTYMQSVKEALMNPMKQKPYKESSVKPVMVYLRKLAGGDFDNLDFLMNRKKVDEILATYAVSTRKTIIFVINNVAKDMDRKDIVKLYSDDVEEANKYKKVIDATTGLPAKTVKQTENWMTWDEVIAVRDALDKDSERYVMLCLYTMMPPRRNRDFLECKVVSRYNAKASKKFNYLVINKSRVTFSFSQYKTSDSFGTQVFEAPKELAVVLRRYYAGKTDGRLMFGEHPSNYITQNLQATLGKNVGSSMLRHIFLEKYKDPETQAVIRDMMGTANAMAHTIGTQQGTYVV